MLFNLTFPIHMGKYVSLNYSKPIHHVSLFRLFGRQTSQRAISTNWVTITWHLTSPFVWVHRGLAFSLGMFIESWTIIGIIFILNYFKILHNQLKCENVISHFLFHTIKILAETYVYFFLNWLAIFISLRHSIHTL